MMRNIYFLLLIFLVSSCQLKDNPFYEEEIEVDSIVVSMDESEDKTEFKINSFAEFPDVTPGRTCFFSLTKNAFLNQQYIYAGKVNHQIGYMQLNGQWIEFSGDIPTINDSLILHAKNDSMQLEIKAVKDSSSLDRIQYRGDIKIDENSKNHFSSSVYGECDC